MLSLLITSTWCKVSRTPAQGLRLVSRLWSLSPPVPPPPSCPPPSVSITDTHSHSPPSLPGVVGKTQVLENKNQKNQKPEFKFWFYPRCDFEQVIYLTSWCLSSMGMRITLPLTPWSMERIRAEDSEAGGPPKLLPG